MTGNLLIVNEVNLKENDKTIKDFIRNIKLIRPIKLENGQNLNFCFFLHKLQRLCTINYAEPG